MKLAPSVRERRVLIPQEKTERSSATSRNKDLPTMDQDSRTAATDDDSRSASDIRSNPELFSSNWWKLPIGQRTVPYCREWWEHDLQFRNPWTGKAMPRRQYQLLQLARGFPGIPWTGRPLNDNPLTARTPNIKSIKEKPSSAFTEEEGEDIPNDRPRTKSTQSTFARRRQGRKRKVIVDDSEESDSEGHTQDLSSASARELASSVYTTKPAPRPVKRPRVTSPTNTDTTAEPDIRRGSSAVPAALPSSRHGGTTGNGEQTTTTYDAQDDVNGGQTASLVHGNQAKDQTPGCPKTGSTTTEQEAGSNAPIVIQKDPGESVSDEPDYKTLDLDGFVALIREEKVRPEAREDLVEAIEHLRGISNSESWDLLLRRWCEMEHRLKYPKSEVSICFSTKY
jgi:hypothetical protein